MTVAKALQGKGRKLSFEKKQPKGGMKKLIEESKQERQTNERPENGAQKNEDGHPAFMGLKNITVWHPRGEFSSFSTVSKREDSFTCKIHSSCSCWDGAEYLYPHW
jgi:hypothetical protein